MTQSRRNFLALAVLLAAGPSARAADPHAADAQSARFALIGLFSPDRVDDLRRIMQDIDGLELVDVGYDAAEATFRYDPARLFENYNPKAPPKPREVQQRISQALASASDNTFTLRDTPAGGADQLSKVSIAVGMCSCKGCRYALYLALLKMPGVDRATVTPDRVAKVWIDAAQTNQAAIEAAIGKIEKQ